MSWVEELTPDDEIDVEIVYPDFFVNYNIATMKKYAAAISHLCKGAAILGQSNVEFTVEEITIPQVYSIEDAMKCFGIKMAHKSGKLLDGTRYTYFCADLTGLKEMLENGEFESV